MTEYARVCQRMPECARICQSMPDARLCRSMSEYARVCPEKLNSLDPQSGKKTLLPSVIHGILTEICYIIIYKRGSLGERTFSLGERTLESSVTNTFPAVKVACFDLLRPRITKIKKTRYQRNVKILIFCFLALHI